MSLQKKALCLHLQASLNLSIFLIGIIWYEIGDMICIGDHDTLYYCFPCQEQDVAAKTRLATEELYKLTKSTRKKESV